MKVSVVIPVFNAENYLAACLNSVFNQTLQDFEVIIVDDCSTDSSLAVANSFFEKFGERLKIISLEKNTGNPSVPRNKGLSFSRGEYVFFMDNDDLITPNAFKLLCNYAEKFRADVVYMERGFLLDGENIISANWDKNSSKISIPTLENQNIAARIENFIQTAYGWAPWTKFLRRDFLIANEIAFPLVKISEDVLWTFKVICLAENFLRIPDQLYICRSRINSWSRIRRNPPDEIKFWLDPLVKGLDYLDDFMKRDFFNQNPNLRFDVTNFFVKMQIAGMLNALKNLNRCQLYEIVHESFSDSKHAALIANLFVVMNFYRDRFLEVK